MPFGSEQVCEQGAEIFAVARMMCARMMSSPTADIIVRLQSGGIGTLKLYHRCGGLIELHCELALPHSDSDGRGRCV